MELDEDFKLQDIGVSAYRGRNATEGKLGAFLKAVRAGKIERGSYLLVESLDRLSRQEERKTLRIFLDIVDAGINIVEVKAGGHVYNAENCDSHDLNRLIITASRAREESETKSIRIQQKWEQKRLNIANVPFNNKGPMWLEPYDYEKKEWRHIPERVKVVQDIFEWSAGAVGIPTIMRRLNDKNVPTFTKGANGWYTSTIAKILLNRAVLGEGQLRQIKDGKRVAIGDVIPGYFPRIISDETFAKAQAIRAERIEGNHPGGRNPGKNFKNLFTNVAKCAYCGGSMLHEDKGKGRMRSLVCWHARRGLRDKCTVTKTWPYLKFQDAFLRHVEKIDYEKVYRADENATARAMLQDEITTLQAEYERISTKMGLLVRMLESDNIAYVQQQLREHETRREEIKATIKQKEQDLASLTSRRADFEGMKEMFAAIKSVDDSAYDLRAKVNNEMCRLVDAIYVATDGTVSREGKPYRPCEGLHMQAIPPDGRVRFFVTKFKDGEAELGGDSEDMYIWSSAGVAEDED